MSTPVCIHVLGPTALSVDGHPVELGSYRQRRLLLALVIEPHATVSADQLADRVWFDGELPADPRRTLRTYLTRIRAALGRDDAIITEPTGWRLDREVVESDVTRFDRLLKTADEPGLDVHRRLALIDEAIGLWRGRPCEEATGEEWVCPEADRLDELRLTALERRYDAMLSAGMHTDALPALAGEVETNPLRDRLVGLHMLALHRSGRTAEAARAFQSYRERLRDLGLDPGAKLVELDRYILSEDPSLELKTPAGRPLHGYRLGEQLGRVPSQSSTGARSLRWVGTWR